MNPIESLLNFASTQVPFHRRRAPKNPLVLADWPLMGMEDMTRYSPDRSSELLSPLRASGGYIIASGGTKQAPKYLFYTHGEAQAVSANIARHLMAAGLEAGDSVVNYFTSGDMWSAFLLLDKALSTLPVSIFPLGYSERMDAALSLLERFEPNTLIGIPSMLLALARFCAERKANIRIAKVFYGGEALTASGRELFQSIWNCELIRSAGYAATDVGAIGWQCQHCRPGEHYAFEDMVVEIVDREIVVTSLQRYGMPVIRYRTGDSGEWVSPNCECAHGAPMFRLKGRRDNVLIIWGCWIDFHEIEMALEALQVRSTGVQLHAYSEGSQHRLRVEFESSKPGLESPPTAAVRDSVYQHCEDLNRSLPRDLLDNCLTIEARAPGSLARNPRTGKIIPIVDLRT